jgi:hypothetical protein
MTIGADSLAQVVGGLSRKGEWKQNDPKFKLSLGYLVSPITTKHNTGTLRLEALGCVTSFLMTESYFSSTI